jgi:hypothetical protein
MITWPHLLAMQHDVLAFFRRPFELGSLARI